MSIDRYLKDDEGLRKYVELMETTPTAKRQTLLDSARKENNLFVSTAEKYILTFERITQLPEMELAEVLGAKSLKPQVVAIAILSVADEGVKERLVKSIPRDVSSNIILEMRERGELKPADIGGARLQMIKKTRELEKEGKLGSIQMPRFRAIQFQKAG